MGGWVGGVALVVKTEREGGGGFPVVLKFVYLFSC